MTFTAMSLSTWVTLFAGLGGAVTLLYMLRMRRRRVEVPFGPLWQKVLTDKQTTSLWRVIKRIFSLLMQLAFIALLLTAIADPRWTGGHAVDFQEPREPEPRHTLLVVDTSASMQATDVEGTRMAAAIAAAGTVVSSMHPAESMMIARMDRDVTAVTDWTKDRAALKASLRGLMAGDTGTDVAPVMQFARNAVRGLPNAQVVLVTDRAFAPPDADLAKAISLKVIPVGSATETANLAVLDFNIRSHLGNGLKYALYAKVKNYGKTPVRAAVYLYGDATGNARRREDFVKLAPSMEPFYLELAPGEEQIVEKEAVDLVGSRAALLVEPYDKKKYSDALPTDDVAYAVVPVRKSVKVLLVGKPDLFLQAALSTRAAVDVLRVEPEAYTTSAGYDLTVFDMAAPKAPDAGSAIYVNVSGGAVPFAADGTVAGGALNVVSDRATHPLMKFIKFVDIEADQVQRFKVRKGDLVMARTKGGRAAVVAHADQEKRWVAVGFDPIGTEWVGHYSFSIFFVNAINWFFAEESKLIRPWSLAKRWDVPVPWKVDRVDVLTPKGARESALVDGGGTLAWTGREEGIYELRKAAGDKDPIIVAAALRSPEESTLGARGDYAVWVPPEIETEAPKLTVFGADLWQILVLLALGLMTVEWFTYHRRWTV